MYFKPSMGKRKDWMQTWQEFQNGFCAFKQNMKSYEKIANAKAINIFIWAKKRLSPRHIKAH